MKDLDGYEALNELKDVISSDKFLAMPRSAQMLYIQAWFMADKNGMVYNMNTIARAIGASGEDIDILLDFGFLVSNKEWEYFVNDLFLSNFREGDENV